MININDWFLFAAFFGFLLIITLVIIRQSQYFYTIDIVLRKFSVMELEIPSNPTELVNLIKGLYKLPPGKMEQTINALKSQLKLNFLFTPVAYGCIFLLSWRVGHKMQSNLGQIVFIGFSILQFIAWIFDIIEKIYLLGKIKPDVIETSKKNHKRYLFMEAAKWGISLTATVCSISAVCYFWLTGAYSRTSIFYLLVVFGEILLFLLASKIFLKKKIVYKV